MTLLYIGIGLVAVLVLAVVFGKCGATGNSPLPPNATNEDILKLAQQGQKIQAIKWYRELHDVGLKDAKDAVERMLGKS